MAWFHGGVPCPKPRPRILDRIEYKRERDAKERAFKAAVWARDKGFCQCCGVKCLKTIAADPKRGEVHHLKPRSTSPEKRYDVDNGQLLCLICHTKATRHL